MEKCKYFGVMFNSDSEERLVVQAVIQTALTINKMLKLCFVGKEYTERYKEVNV